MLAHPFPRVRRFTADQLYMRLLEDSMIVSDQHNVDGAMELLLNTPWDADFELCNFRETRNQAAHMVGICLPLDKKLVERVVKKQGSIVDEYESYASLVGEVSR